MILLTIIKIIRDGSRNSLEKLKIWAIKVSSLEPENS